MNFLGFPHIESFHNVVKLVQRYPELGSSFTYRGKVKLHGTNASVQIRESKVVAQSRTQTITANADNVGFAKWVDTNLEYWESLNSQSEPMTVFGEWCGPGIMKGTAIQGIPNKIFAVFAIMIGEGDDARMIVDNIDIAMKLYTNDHPKDIEILPWYGDEITIDFTNRQNLLDTAEKINKVVESVEPCDPWVEQNFGVKGVGEGVVYYPNYTHSVSRKEFSNFCFKAKGEKHRVNHTKQSVQVDPGISRSIQEFVANFVTEQRLEQGLTFVPADVTMTGQFVKWVAEDVLRESKDELEASELTWKQVNGEVQKAARTWFLAKAKVIV